jgi:2,3-bisphosphoglycerate-independent phosphoglycerate mutase
MPVPRPLVLCVLDGVGERAETDGNALAAASTPVLDELRKTCATTVLEAAGPALGLPPGRPGSGDVGHLALGAGRVPASACAAVDALVQKRKLAFTPALDQTMRLVLYDSMRLHLFTVVGESGIHATLDHLIAVLDVAAFQEVPVVVHAILDGAQGSRRGASPHLEMLQGQLEGKQAILATLSGRACAMDQEGRWDRTEQAFHAIVRDKVLGPPAPRADSWFDALSLGYGQGVDDDRITPIRLGDYEGVRGDFMCEFGGVTAPVWTWTGTEYGLALPFRGDCMRQLVSMLTCRDVPDEVKHDILMDRKYPVLAFPEHHFATLTSYGERLGLPACVAQPAVDDGFAEVLARAGKRQLRCAESVKAAHVTRHFNGGRDEPFPGEDHRILPSSRLVDSHAEKPAMASARIAAAVEAAVAAGEHDFILVNLANADVVAHTGNLDATAAAIAAVDHALGRIVAATRAAGGAVLVTSDHGGCEAMLDTKGRPRRGHSASPVPLFYVCDDDKGATLRPGSLCDVAPTMLDILGLERSAAMTGRSLLGRGG